METISGIISLLIILSVLVVVHEFGHFLFAKLCKMRVDEFALFFGPKICTLGKWGGTEYNIRSIPLGGFVKIAGMEADDISGGRPILDALRNPAFLDPDGIRVLTDKIGSEALSEVKMENVSQEVKSLLASSIGPDGLLLESRREELEMKQASPVINEDEKKLIQLIILADHRATDEGLYSQRPLYQRGLAIFGGPLFSILFGFLVFCVMGMTFGLPSDKLTNQVQVFPTLSSRPRLSGQKPASAKMDEKSPAVQAGIKTGDRIISVAGVPTPTGEALSNQIHKRPNQTIQIVLNRGGNELTVTATTASDVFVKRDKDGKEVKINGVVQKETVGIIGITPISLFERTSFKESIIAGTNYTLGYVVTLASIFKKRDFSNSMGGPVAMGQVTIATQKLGYAPLIMMAGTFSLSLGIMNLLPIPILDGGHLMLLTWEGLRRRRLSPKEIYNAQVVGLAMLAVMVIFVMYNDIFRTLAGKGYQ